MKRLLLIVLMLFYGTAFSQSVETVGTPEFDIRDELDNTYNLIRTDQDGDVIWSRTINQSNNPFDMSQGTYIVCGFTDIVNGRIVDNPCDYDYWIVRIADNIEASIYPNPASQEFNVVLNSYVDGLILELYDIHFRRINSYTLSNYVTQITLPNVSNGMYIYNLTNNNKLIKTGKVCIMQNN